MVGVNFYLHQIGVVAFLATLFLASFVRSEKECKFDFKNEILDSAYDLECNNLKNSWEISDEKSQKALVLGPELSGCLKTRQFVALNASSDVKLRFFYEGSKEDIGKITIKLIPKSGTCEDESCTWKIEKDLIVPGKWVDTSQQFSIAKDLKQYFIQLEVEKSKGKFIVESITVVQPGECQTEMPLNPSDVVFAEQRLNPSNTSGTEGGNGGDNGGSSGKGGSSNSSSVDCFTLFSKNLMLTSASVLTLNNLLN